MCSIQKKCLDDKNWWYKSIYLYMPTLGDPKKNLQIYPLRPSIHPPQSVFPYANPVNPSRITKLWETHSSTARGTAVLYCLVNSGIHPESLPHSNLSFQAGKTKLPHPDQKGTPPASQPFGWSIPAASVPLAIQIELGSTLKAGQMLAWNYTRRLPNLYIGSTSILIGPITVCWSGYISTQIR